MYQIELKAHLVAHRFRPNEGWVVTVDVDPMERAHGGQHAAGKKVRAQGAERHLRSLGVTLARHHDFGRADVVATHPVHGTIVVEAEGESSKQKGQAVYSALGQLVLSMRSFKHGVSYALAVPDEDDWLRQVRKIPPVVASVLHMSVLAVSSNGVREIELPGRETQHLPKGRSRADQLPSRVDHPEEIRLLYRPERISVLLVGESPANNGSFFYCANSRLYTYTAEAFRRALGVRVDDPKRFLSMFKQAGCYLEDLSLKPLNGLGNSERRQARREAVPGLKRRVESASPQVVICVMKGIADLVRGAVSEAGFSTVPFYTVPFPAMGHEEECAKALARILRRLSKRGLLDRTVQKRSPKRRR